MAKTWSGFIPQNTDAKEQWAMLEAWEMQNREMLESGRHSTVHEDQSPVRQLETLLNLLSQRTP